MVEVVALLVRGYRVVGRLTYCRHRTRSPAHHPVSRRPKHQAIKPSPAVRSHDDEIRFLCLGKRQNHVRSYALVHNELWLKFCACVVFHEF